MQLPLAVSGWGFQEEFSEVKIEKMEEECDTLDSTVKGTVPSGVSTVFSNWD